MPASLAEIIIPVCASLGGALVAGFASYLAGRGMRSHEWKLALIRERLLERQRLYAKFLTETDRYLFAVAVKGEKTIDNVTPLFALFAEISLLSSKPVQDCAKRVCELALSANAKESEREEGDHFGAKAAFLDAAREELAQLEAGAGKALP